MLSDPARAVARALGCKAHTSMFYIIEVIATFVFAAVAHMFMLPFHNTGFSRTDIFVFFLLQPIAVFCEVALESFFEKGVDEGRKRTLRWILTLAWLYFSVPLAGIQFSRAGVWPVRPIPISLTSEALEGKLWVG